MRYIGITQDVLIVTILDINVIQMHLSLLSMCRINSYYIRYKRDIFLNNNNELDSINSYYIRYKQCHASKAIGKRK